MFNIEPERAIAGKDEDLLEFGSKTGPIVSYIRGAKPPFVFGIFGPWGSGKTSFMRLIEGELSSDGTVIPVWFDAWKYDGTFPLIYPLGKTLERFANDRCLSNVSGEADMLLRSLVLVGSQIGAGALKKVTGIDLSASAMKDLEDLAKKEESLLGRWFDEVHELRNCVEGYVRKLIDALAKEKGVDPAELKLCVFIDDLDRCSPTHALALLDGIRLYFDVPGLVFVLGISPETIAQAVRSKYGDDEELTRDYAQKVIQLSISVPVCSAKASDIIRPTLERASINPNEALLKFAAELSKAFEEANNSNPRLMKRLAIRLPYTYAALEVHGANLAPQCARIMVLKALYPKVLELHLVEGRFIQQLIQWHESEIHNTRATMKNNFGPELIAKIEAYSTAFPLCSAMRTVSPGLNLLERGNLEVLLQIEPYL